jgi:hypothetical protein
MRPGNQSQCVLCMLHACCKCAVHARTTCSGAPCTDLGPRKPMSVHVNWPCRRSRKGKRPRRTSINIGARACLSRSVDRERSIAPRDCTVHRQAGSTTRSGRHGPAVPTESSRVIGTTRLRCTAATRFLPFLARTRRSGKLIWRGRRGRRSQCNHRAAWPPSSRRIVGPARPPPPSKPPCSHART